MTCWRRGMAASCWLRSERGRARRVWDLGSAGSLGGGGGLVGGCFCAWGDWVGGRGGVRSGKGCGFRVVRSMDQVVRDFSYYVGNAEEFPILRGWDFFNHAGVSPLPRVGAEAMRRFAGQYEAGAYLESGFYREIEG